MATKHPCLDSEPSFELDHHVEDTTSQNTPCRLDKLNYLLKGLEFIHNTLTITKDLLPSSLRLNSLISIFVKC